jgi:hypothetical protein
MTNVAAAVVELRLKRGDVVLFSSCAGYEFEVGGKQKVLLMREDDILAVMISRSPFLPCEPTTSPPPPEPETPA